MGFCSLDGYSNRTTCEANGGTWTDSPPSYEYAYYIKGNKLAVVEKDTDFDNDVNSKDYGPGSHRSQWKSPKTTVADGIEVQYVYSPEYIINKSNAKSTNLNQYWSISTTHEGENHHVVRFGESGGTVDFSGSPYNLAAEDYFVLTGAGKFNGLHKVISLSTGGINTYTRAPSNLAGASSKSTFEETVTLYYDVNVLNNEHDKIDLPTYLNRALVYYVKAQLAEDQRDIEGKEYFMREFKRIVEKYNNTRVAGVRRVATGVHAIR